MGNHTRKCDVAECATAMATAGYCSYHYRQMRKHGRIVQAAVPSIVCDVCGSEFQSRRTNARFCSYPCRLKGYAADRNPIRPDPDPLVDPDAFRTFLKSNTFVTGGGCWEWLGTLSPTGYAICSSGHIARFSCELRHGKPLGKQSAHHMCANNPCVNPDHIQAISQRENAAEMFERKYYRSRIADLESALADIAPDHELLREIRIPSESTQEVES